MATTSLLIGSIDNWTDDTVTSPSGTISAAEGALYLDHATSALSLLDQVVSTLGASSAVLLQNGYTKITFASPTAITWGAATATRDALGFTGDSASATTHTSDGPSPLVFFPLRQEEPRASILGVSGATSHLLDVSSSRDGEQTVVRFGANKRNAFAWRWVPQSKFWTSSEANGEWYQFFNDTLIRGRRFQLYRGVTMDDSSSSTASYSSPLGTFQADVRALGMSVKTMRSEGFDTVDSMFDIDLPVIEVAEYD